MTKRSIEAQIAEAEQKLARLKNLQSQRKRKDDARRKIILGGGLIAAAEDGDDHAQRLIEAIRHGLDRDVDRRVFEGWSLKKRGGA